MAASGLARYRGRPYDGPVVMLRATERRKYHARFEPRDMGWGPHLTGAFSIVDIPGNHEDMVHGEHLSSAIAALAEPLAAAELRAAAARATSRRGPSSPVRSAREPRRARGDQSRSG